MAEATREARTPLVSPTATSSSLQATVTSAGAAGAPAADVAGVTFAGAGGWGRHGAGSRFDFLLRPTRPTF
jgi:hypothetical protein